MRTVLLDLDGTLADSAALITGHLAEALAGVGRHHRPDELRHLVGPPFEEALPALGLSTTEMEQVVAAYRASYYPAAAVGTPLYPGVPALLDRLVAAGLRLAVATSKGEQAAAAIVAGTGIADRIALVGGSDPAVGRIGKGRVVESVLQRLGADPAREPVVMVGDRHHDVDGAAAHGVPTVGVSWGYAAPGELGGARVVVATPAELAETLLAGDPTLWSAALSPA